MAGLLATARARVLRRRQPVYDGGLSTLRRFQDDVKEVRVRPRMRHQARRLQRISGGRHHRVLSTRANRAETVSSQSAVERCEFERRIVSTSTRLSRSQHHHETSTTTRKRTGETRAEQHHHARNEFRRGTGDHQSVDVTPDLKNAHVFVSVLGADNGARRDRQAGGASRRRSGRTVPARRLEIHAASHFSSRRFHRTRRARA